MPNFECTSSTTENGIKIRPLTFENLQTLYNILIRETQDLQQEFDMKTQFVNEQFKKIFENEQQLENIFNMTLELQEDVSAVEMELQELDHLFSNFLQNRANIELLNRMETFCTQRNCSCHCCYFSPCNTGRENFLELLQIVNRKIEKLPALLEDMKELEAYRKLRTPYADIVAILGFHCDILKNIEKKLDLVLDMLPLIELQELSLKPQVK